MSSFPSLLKQVHWIVYILHIFELYISIYACVCTCVHVYVCVYIHTHIHAHAHAHAHTRMETIYGYFNLIWFVLISISQQSLQQTAWPHYMFVWVCFPSCCVTAATSQWARWRLKSPAYRLFTQPFVQAQTKEDTKALRHWPLWGEFIGDRWIPRTQGQ